MFHRFQTNPFEGRTLNLVTIVQGRQVFWKPYKEA